MSDAKGEKTCSNLVPLVELCSEFHVSCLCSFYAQDPEPWHDRTVAVGFGGARSHDDEPDLHGFHLESRPGSYGQPHHGVCLGQVS